MPLHSADVRLTVVDKCLPHVADSLQDGANRYPSTHSSTEMNMHHVSGSPGGRERRRAVRRRVEDQPASMPFIASVQVMDISRTGVLLAADCAFTPGDRGTLCVEINGSSLNAAIQVERVAPARTGGHRYELGSSFVTSSPERNLLLGYI